MLQPDCWPFTPERLSDIIEPETLSVITAGCCERIGRSLSILDADPNPSRSERVDAVNPRQNFALFCAYLRHADHFAGGNAACELFDANVAITAKRTDSAQAYRRHICHMGLADSRYVLKVRGHPVGVMLCGQFRPEQGLEQIHERVSSLGTGVHQAIEPQHERAQTTLLQFSDKLTLEPADFAEKLEREAKLVQQIAETAYQQKKTNWEQNFLDQLRQMRALGEVDDLHEIAQRAGRLLRAVLNYCHAQFVVLYAGLQANENVLTPVAHAGLPEWSKEKLPHFNWRKAGLPLESENQINQWLIQDRAVLRRGLRGDNPGFFLNHSVGVAITLGQSYRLLLLFGEFAEPLDLEYEKPFLFQIVRIVGWSIYNEMQVLMLHNKQKELKSRAALTTHQVRTALTPISTYVATAKLLARTPPNENGLKMMRNALKGAQELCIRLGSSVSETVKSSVLLQEHDDMKFDLYPLSVLIANCAEGFVPEAAQHQRQLSIHESIELLPSAEVDIARLTIAISNLIDNAVKYSFPNTRIIVRAAVHGDTSLDFENAEIEIQNDGNEIPLDKRERIFLQGERGLTAAKLQRIPGTGLGLWEARAVIENHRGKIKVKCDRMPFFYRQQQAYRVVFTVIVPLRQTNS